MAGNTMTEVKVISRQNLDALDRYPEVRRLIQKASESGYPPTSGVEMYDKLLQGEAIIFTLWRDEELIFLTSLQAYTDQWGKMYGDLQQTASSQFITEEDLQIMDKAVTDHARTLGCQVLEFVGRKGWQKKLRGLDYKAVRTVYRKEL